MVYQFNTLTDMVDAVGQLTDDLVNISTDVVELIIRINKGEIPEETKIWLEEVCYKVSAYGS